MNTSDGRPRSRSRSSSPTASRWVPTRLSVPARRTAHVRFNALDDPEPVLSDTDYASVTESSVPIVVPHSRPDSRQAENVLMTMIAHPAR